MGCVTADVSDVYIDDRIGAPFVKSVDSFVTTFMVFGVFGVDAQTCPCTVSTRVNISTHVQDKTRQKKQDGIVPHGASVGFL
jgi:hypothetical protein